MRVPAWGGSSDLPRDPPVWTPPTVVRSQVDCDHSDADEAPLPIALFADSRPAANGHVEVEGHLAADRRMAVVDCVLYVLEPSSWGSSFRRAHDRRIARRVTFTASRPNAVELLSAAVREAAEWITLGLRALENEEALRALAGKDES